MHEIISIQLGLESNYLATHFWNAQVSSTTQAGLDADDMQESYFPLNAGEESPVDSDVNFRVSILVRRLRLQLTSCSVASNYLAPRRTTPER
jgi:hypothetical protein